eukprot:2182876-Rhodomonas_salina.1
MPGGTPEAPPRKASSDTRPSPLGAWREIVSPVTEALGTGPSVSPMMGADSDGEKVSPMRPMSSLDSGDEGMDEAAVSSAFAQDILQGLSQRNLIFSIADPNSPDCPLTFVSDAFCEFT